MGLISKTVIVKWNGRNKKLYEDKGYLFTKMGDEFEVKVDDLTNGSNALVNVKCDDDDCKIPYLKPMQWYYYLQSVKENGKYFCQHCRQSTSIIKTNKSKLLTSKSFHQWCVDNNRQDILDRWDYVLNDCDPNDVSYASHKKFYFKCSNGMHKSELKNINNFVKDINGIMICNQCNSFAQYLIDLYGENALYLYWDYIKNKNINPWLISRSCANPKVWIKCQEKDYHGSYLLSCNSFSNNGRCNFCNPKSGVVHPLDSLGTLHPETINLWSDRNKKSPYEYAPMSNKYAYFKCAEGKHEDFRSNIQNANSHDFRCPDCVRERDESFLQEKVRLYITDLGYGLLNERKCNIKCINPKTKSLLPYDNEIKELELIIEVMGMQHYRITSFANQQAKRNSTTPEYELHYQKLKDRYKRIFAKSQGYYYLEIPYFSDDKEETWKKLIDKMLANII